jgi:nucleoid DNA-binding protein
MNHKDLVKYIRAHTSLTYKEINAVLRNFGKFLIAANTDKIPFMWKGVLSVTYVQTKETTRIFKGASIKIPAKTKTKVKLCG